MDLDLLYILCFALTILVAFASLREVRTLKLLIPLLLVTLLVNILCKILKEYDYNNLFLFHFFTPVEYCFIAAIYYQNLSVELTKKIIICSAAVLIIISFVSANFIEGLAKNNSYAGIVSNLFVIGLCVLYLIEIYRCEDNSDLKKNPLFWITFGLLFYNSGNLFIQGSLNYLMDRNMRVAGVIYNISYSFSFILFLSIIIAACFYKKENLWKKSP